jgi:hypothetical protein
MKTKKIQRISEAFSMQPNNVCIMNENDNYYDKPRKCKEIKLELISLGKVYGQDVEDLYYVCYNFEGLPFAQFLAKTMNVEFVV